MPKVLDSMPTTTPKSQPALKPAAAQQLQRPPAATQPTPRAAKVNNRKIYFPNLLINGIEIPRDRLRITVAQAKDMLGWETEAEYAERMSTKVAVERGGGLSREFYQFRPPNSDDPKLANAPEYHVKLADGTKVICWRNVNNRPLDEGWVDRLAQDILTHNYLFNGEAIILSKTRLVMSGQHRLFSLIWAYHQWCGPNRDHWLQYWNEEPYIESIVSQGVDETPEILMTLDNTKARTEADNFYTSDLIDWTRTVRVKTSDGTIATQQAALSSVQKKECAKYLQSALDLLWRRTGAEGTGSFSRYKTHSVSMDFVKKHETILRCVRHIWEENTSEGRAISALDLSPGHCSAILYLMGSCESDGDAYRHYPSTAERNESGLDWSMLDKAKAFFSLLAASSPDNESGDRATIKAFAPVRKAFGLIVDPEAGSGGRQAERHAILAKAWAVWIQGHQIEDGDLALRYDEEKDTAGNVVSRTLDECPTFGGIDLGIVRKPKTDRPAGAPSPTVQDIEVAKADANRRNDELLKQRVEEAKARNTPTQAEVMKRNLAEQKAAFPGKLLLWRTASGGYAVWGTDALLISQTIGVDVLDNTDPPKLAISKADAAEHLATIAANHTNAVVLSKPAVPAGQEAKVVAEPIASVLEGYAAPTS